ncbi:alpha-amylase family glycosyl hydrolase [Halomonas shantousis]
MPTWTSDAVFYHIYPLGQCGAPRTNDFSSAPEPRLAQLNAWIEHLQYLGINAVYLGPVFESTAHGYDTADYTRVDRRLGTHQTLAELVAAFHQQGIRVLLDGVFHHVGRHFGPFRDLQRHLQASPYRDWFAGVDFDRESPDGDAFAYDGWHGHYDLVKLNLHHPEVREHLFDAVAKWIREFDIDGLRLDVAESIDDDFLRALADFCRQQRQDFLLIGETIHGDYRRWANPDTLDSTTNYECYKGLWSSLNDRNFFEITYSLNREFGPEGIYRHLPLYNFVDNHDVDRIASTLRQPEHLYPLYLLLFSIPGMPSIYAGSEWGIQGERQAGNDSALRPAMPSPEVRHNAPHPELADYIARLAHIRHTSPALCHGDYRQAAVHHEQLGFIRQVEEECVLVAVNATAQPVALTLDAPVADGSVFIDLLEPQRRFEAHGGQVHIETLPAYGGRILSLRA